jgi:PAS domain S-box-containing protein
MKKKQGSTPVPDAADRCRSLYAFIRQRLGDRVSDREIARRWDMEWKSFAALKHGKRQVPRIDELERLAAALHVPAAEVFRAASATPSAAEAPNAHSPSADALGLTLDRVPNALFTIDVNGRIRDFNRALPVLTGRTERELRERSVLDLVAVESTSRALACIASATREGHDSEAEVVLFTPKSMHKIVTLRATPVRAADGSVIGAQVIARDVTAERDLAGDLNAQRRILQTVFDRIPAACILFAADGTILAANPLVETVCEATASEIVGRNAFDVFGNPGPEGCPVTRAFQTKRVEQQVSWLKNRRGQAV